jgi:hypothetical protein
MVHKGAQHPHCYRCVLFRFAARLTSFAVVSFPVRRVLAVFSRFHSCFVPSSPVSSLLLLDDCSRATQPTPPRQWTIVPRTQNAKLKRAVLFSAACCVCCSGCCGFRDFAGTVEMHACIQAVASCYPSRTTCQVLLCRLILSNVLACVNVPQTTEAATGDSELGCRLSTDPCTVGCLRKGGTGRAANGERRTYPARARRKEARRTKRDREKERDRGRRKRSSTSSRSDDRRSVCAGAPQRTVVQSVSNCSRIRCRLLPLDPQCMIGVYSYDPRNSRTPNVRASLRCRAPVPTLGVSALPKSPMSAARKSQSAHRASAPPVAPPAAAAIPVVAAAAPPPARAASQRARAAIMAANAPVPAIRDPPRSAPAKASRKRKADRSLHPSRATAWFDGATFRCSPLA